MTADDPASRGFSLKRWAERKLEASRAASAKPPAAPASALMDPAPAVTASPPSPTSPAAADGAAARESALALPAVESLTIDSDFSVFLGPKVDPAVKLSALRKLFRDSRFNVMDGLDVYIDDYSIADPLEPELARKLAHARYVFDPPRTRVNASGIVEDITDAEAPIGENASATDATVAAAASLPEGAMPPTAAAPTQPTGAPEAAPAGTTRPNGASDSASSTIEGRLHEGSEPARR
ncbi:MAG TPA: DUF3306 domain-containing protein [Casimicrobiaceae bacterium]|nr:DUF3306 domain-containing protein [Casimicrobiaceae bacterium]